MNRTLSLMLAGSVVAATAATTLTNPAVATTAGGPSAIGLASNGTLVSFRVYNPSSAYVLGEVKGLDGDTKLIGIDYRPANGVLYGVGDQGGIYTFTDTLGAKTTGTKVSQLTIALEGTSFGVDFNPAADRLRIVSNTGQNLRHDVVGGVTALDLPLNTPPAVGNTLGINAAAYVNNDNDADTGTLLFDLDTNLDQTVAQVPANSGTLSLVGKLGVDATGDAGYDIYSRLVDGQAVANTGYAVLNVLDRSALYKVDPTTGGATLIKSFPKKFDVVDLAVGLR